MLRKCSSLLTATVMAVAGLAFATSNVSAATVPTNYFNGFETNTNGWNVFGGTNDATRVASGTNGVTSATGSYHAESSLSGSAGNWGGYSDTFVPYDTSVDVYLDVNAGYANDTRSNFSSAINDTTGSFRRDFVFNFGFYDSSDNSGPGAGTNRFVFSASNNAARSNSYPKNPGRDAISVSQTGWYTLKHEFRDNGGILDVTMLLIDPSDTVVNTWTLSNATDLIGSTVGGNRYGWFADNEIPNLAFDNARLSVVPVPATLPAGLALLGLCGVGLLIHRRRRAA